MVQTTKLFLVPGSLPFLTIGLAAGVAMLYGRPRIQIWARRWLSVLVAGYAFMATPIGADLIAWPLTRQYGTLTSPREAAGLDTIVALTTGNLVYRANGMEVAEMGKATSHNAMETARVYRLLEAPTVIATGGIVIPGQQRTPEAAALCEGLVRLGVPRDRIVLETQARTTDEQARYTADLLRQRRTTRFVLVTDSQHMPRAMSVFRKRGLEPVPSVSVLRDTPPPGIIYRLRPSLSAFLQSDRACYEYLARIYYWVRN